MYLFVPTPTLLLTIVQTSFLWASKTSDPITGHVIGYLLKITARLIASSSGTHRDFNYFTDSSLHSRPSSHKRTLVYSSELSVLYVVLCPCSGPLGNYLDEVVLLSYSLMITPHLFIEKTSAFCSTSILEHIFDLAESSRLTRLANKLDLVLQETCRPWTHCRPLLTHPPPL